METEQSRAGRRHLAIFSVLPPTSSGIATYTRRLVEALAEVVDVTCFFAGNEPIGSYSPNVSIRDTRSFEPRRDGRLFDALVYCLGNNAIHAEHVNLALSVPGVVLLHEPRLANARRPVVVPDDGAFLCADVCRVARQVCVHSHAAARIVERESGRQATMVGPLALPPFSTRPTERRLLVSAGIVASVKHAELLVDAFGLLSHHMPHTRLAFVGPCGPDERKSLLGVAHRHGIAHRLLITGEVSDADYAKLIGSASVAIQLRATSHGESSAAVNDALALSVPTVVTDIGSFAEMPDQVVVKVARDVSASDLAGTIISIASDEKRRAALVANASAYTLENSFAAAARRLIAAVMP